MALKVKAQDYSTHSLRPFTTSAMDENQAGLKPMLFQTMRLSGEINTKYGVAGKSQ